jgi:hypothetical protein
MTRFRKKLWQGISLEKGVAVLLQMAASADWHDGQTPIGGLHDANCDG